MIVGVSIYNYKTIQSLERLPLSDFHVLVGPNGSGKTTFLDAIDFVRDCLIHSPRVAVEMRGVGDFRDLTWGRFGNEFGIGLWFDLKSVLPGSRGGIFSYFISVCQNKNEGVHVTSEYLAWNNVDIFKNFSNSVQSLFYAAISVDGEFHYLNEKSGLLTFFKFSRDRLALSLVPPDLEAFPTANAIKDFLIKGVRYVQLNSRAMRMPCPAIRGSDYELDGSNIARVVGRLMRDAGGGVADERGVRWTDGDNPITRWVEHLRYALPDLAAVGWSRRLADNAEYIVLRYENGLEAPSWLLSDGTLRMLGLTLPAFLPPEPAIYLVEEPENGVHPKALDIILGSLSSIPDAQVMVATHSPLVVQRAGRDALLCFSRDEDGAKIIPGSQHPALTDWDETPDLATIFAAGVLE
jgi:hypothetical protein